MRSALLLAVLALAACANTHPLPYASVDDPVWRVAPDKWQSSDNQITTPPTLPNGHGTGGL